MQLQKYTKEWLEQLCSESYSLAEVLRKANRKPTGGNYEILKMKIKNENSYSKMKKYCENLAIFE